MQNKEKKNEITYLSAAFDNIKGTHNSVGKPAGENSSNHTLGVVAHVMDVTHISALFM